MIDDLELIADETGLAEQGSDEMAFSRRAALALRVRHDGASVTRGRRLEVKT